MKILKSANYKEAIAQNKKKQRCRECGNLAVVNNGLCQKCQEEAESRKETYRN